jgi:hypothetical protein
MMRTVGSRAAICLCAIATMLWVVPAAGGDHRSGATAATAHHEGAAHEYHRNHFGGLLGTSVHLDNDDTAFTLGLEYARQFAPRWAVAGYVESVSSDIERDVIVAAGIIYYPVSRLGLLLAPGIESAAKDVEHHGEVEREYETEFLIRLGASYGFPVAPQASIGPVLLVDRSAHRWTVVIAVGTVVGF